MAFNVSHIYIEVHVAFFGNKHELSINEDMTTNILSIEASPIELAEFRVSGESSAESDPATVTVIFYWRLLDSISSADQNITYTVTVTYMNDTVVAGQSVAHPNSSLKIPGLPACTILRATLVAERNNESSNLWLPIFTFESFGESYFINL